MKVKRFLLAMCAVSFVTFNCIGASPAKMYLHDTDGSADKAVVFPKVVVEKIIDETVKEVIKNHQSKGLQSLDIEEPSVTPNDPRNLEHFGVNEIVTFTTRKIDMHNKKEVHKVLSDEMHKRFEELERSIAVKNLNPQPRSDDEAIKKLGLVKIDALPSVDSDVKDLNSLIAGRNKVQFMVLDAYVNPKPMEDLHSGDITFLTHVVLKGHAKVLGEKDNKKLLLTRGATIRHFKNATSEVRVQGLVYRIIVDDVVHKVYDILDRSDGTEVDLSTIDAALQEQIIEIQPGTQIYDIAITMYEAATGKKW